MKKLLSEILAYHNFSAQRSLPSRMYQCGNLAKYFMHEKMFSKSVFEGRWKGRLQASKMKKSRQDGER